MPDLHHEPTVPPGPGSAANGIRAIPLGHGSTCPLILWQPEDESLAIEARSIVRQGAAGARIIELPSCPDLAAEVATVLSRAHHRLQALADDDGTILYVATGPCILDLPSAQTLLWSADPPCLDRIAEAAASGRPICYVTGAGIADRGMIAAMRRVPGVLLLPDGSKPDLRILSRMIEASVGIVSSPQAAGQAYAPALLRQFVLADLANNRRKSGSAAHVMAWADVTSMLRRPRNRRILFDVTQLSRYDAATGIQRVTRQLGLELARHAWLHLDFVPVITAEQGGELVLRRHDAFLAAQPGSVPLEFWHIETVTPGDGDIYLNVDVNLEGTLQLANDGRFAVWRRRGLLTTVLIHDLLPLDRPDDFPDGLPQRFGQWFEAVIAAADMVLATTPVGTALLRERIAGIGPSGAPRIGTLPLGAAIPDERHRTVSAELSGHLLVVGTIEPRKGHADILAALGELWRRGETTPLVFAGRPGWKSEGLQSRIRGHPEFGKRLVWRDACSDDDLHGLYAGAKGLIMPSRAEGFGLPILEAAQHGLPLLLRDIPVFRDVAGDHASYFRGTSGAALATEVADWLIAVDRGLAPASRGLQSLTWVATAQRLIGLLRNLAESEGA